MNAAQFTPGMGSKKGPLRKITGRFGRHPGGLTSVALECGHGAYTEAATRRARCRRCAAKARGEQ